MRIAGAQGVTKLTKKLKLAIETTLGVADSSRFEGSSGSVTMLMCASPMDLTAEPSYLQYQHGAE
jgi:hypothetical protein